MMAATKSLFAFIAVTIAFARSAKLGTTAALDEAVNVDNNVEPADANVTLTEVVLDNFDLQSGTTIYYMNNLCGKKILINSRDAVRVAPWSNKHPTSHIGCQLVVESFRYQKYDLVITFKSMDLSAGDVTGTCRASRLDLYDGPTTARLMSGTKGICGSSAPKAQYTTNTNALTMVYSTGAIHDARQYFDAVITPFHYGHCRQHEFKCSNRRCVHDKLLCDGYNNCGDNSDEAHCAILGLSIMAIVGIAVGCVVLIGIIVTIVICKCCCAVCGYERL